jgi:cellulose synthase/poly-beta-1,6-N-acetylglucosamine synthase-like glycosyltransferase
MKKFKADHIKTLWDDRYKLLPHIIVTSILIFLIIRVLFRSHSANDILYIYGLMVISILSLTFVVSLTKYKDLYQSAARMKKLPRKNPLVSCIVAVFNEEDAIELCIQSMVRQTYKNKEIIIVNDRSTDGTAKVLNRLKKKYSIRVIHLRKNVGKKAALAKGILAAKGTIYAFTDSDSTWEKDAITRIARIFKAYPDIGGVSGHTRVTNADTNFLTKVQDSWYEGQYSIRKAYESVFSSVSCVSGPLAVFRKEAIYNFIPAWVNDSFLGQPFRFATDRTLTAIVLGNQYIGKKLIKRYPDYRFQKVIEPPRDWRVVYCKSARASTIVPDTFGSVIKQQVRWKKSFVRNIFYNGPFYWRKPFGAALIYYFHVAFVLVGPLVAFRHVIYLPLHGNFSSMFLYFGGICFVGFMFGLAFKLENPKSARWIYRPAMSLFSTLVLSWLIFYSVLTIKKMVWYRA